MTTLTAPDCLLLTYVADTYRVTYRDEHARIARAVALVEAGNVTLLPDGTATVRSQKGTVTYTVADGHCNCFDQSAKDGQCKHVYAKTFSRKVTCLRRKARHAMYLDGDGVQVPGIAWPSLDGLQILYAPDEDCRADRMWPVTAAHVVLLGYVE